MLTLCFHKPSLRVCQINGLKRGNRLLLGPLCGWAALLVSSGAAPHSRGTGKKIGNLPVRGGGRDVLITHSILPGRSNCAAQQRRPSAGGGASTCLLLLLLFCLPLSAPAFLFGSSLATPGQPSQQADECESAPSRRMYTLTHSLCFPCSMGSSSSSSGWWGGCHGGTSRRLVRGARSVEARNGLIWASRFSKQLVHLLSF